MSQSKGSGMCGYTPRNAWACYPKICKREVCPIELMWKNGDNQTFRPPAPGLVEDEETNPQA